MKLRVTTILAALSLIFTFGCINQSFETDPKTPVNFEDLNVSSDFTWATGRDVQFSITAENALVVTITSLDGLIQYHKGFYSQLKEFKDSNLVTTPYIVNIYIPTYVKKVLVNGLQVDLNETTVEISLLSAALHSSKLRSARAVSIPGLIAGWHLDENSGDVANDYVGVNNGTFTGANWVVGISGKALEFNGVDGELVIPNNAGLNLVGDKVSFSFWFKLSDVGSSGAFIHNNVKYVLQMDAQGRVSFALYTPSWKSIVMTYSDRILNTDWHHVAATYDGTTMKLFIDGVLKASDFNSGALHASSADVYIGKMGPIKPFKGIIDEVQVYNVALTESQVNQLFTTTPNRGDGSESLIASWELNENSGTVATDKKDINNGIISNATWGTGIKGSCLEFNGTSSNVNMVNSPNLNPVSAITMMAWVKAKDNRTAKILQKGDWDGHGIGIGKWDGWNVSIRTADNVSHLIHWGGGIPVMNEWYHLALTYDGATMKMYVNGQLKNSAAVTGNLNVNGRNASIGSDNGVQKFFWGSIDEVKMFSAALSQTEIQAHFDDQNIASDSDGDGVSDSEDTYPNDPARAFKNYFPADGFGSLAFEDLWPGKGDYDFNDLVVDYRFTIVTNSANKVTEVLSTFVTRALGAEFANGFGFQFPGANILSSNVQVEGCKLLDNYITLNDNGTEANQNKVTVIVFDNAKKIMQSVSGFGVNVVPGTPYVKPDTMVVNIGFTPGVYSISDLNLNNFNPFLIVNKERGKEIHLPNYAPTNLADPAYFNTSEDASNPSTGVYYKTAENLPWAINLASSYDYTIEGAMVTNAYTKFRNWAETSGLQFPDWYVKKDGYRNTGSIYVKP